MGENVLNELRLLLAMYEQADIRFHDPEIANLVENCIPILDSVSLTIRLNEQTELDVRLPVGYPEEERLSAYCRISSKSPAFVLSRAAVQQWQSQFNNDLRQKYLTCHEKEDNIPTILGVIQWCNEQLELFPIPSSSSDNSVSCSTANKQVTRVDLSTCCRIWIFSHHIYNKNKRKFLVNTAEELDLSGFSLPGKPGFICVEGEAKNCDEYWSRVRQLCWQKISLIERQTFPSTENIFDRKPFEELHCDKSAFIKFLEEKNSSEIIKDYLGI